MQIDWNGYSGLTGGCGGNGLLDGTDSMQLIHKSRFLCISTSIPGQKNELCALRIIDVTPWCPTCRLFRTSFLSSFGITTWSLKKSSFLRSLRCSCVFQNSRAAVGSSDLVVGNAVLSLVAVVSSIYVTFYIQ